MLSKPKIGIVGLGMVGEHLKRYFELKGFKRAKNLFCYDTDPKKNCSDNISQAKIIFVCVPTPSKKDGSCDTRIVESVVKKYAKSARAIVIKSTMPPGTAECLAKKYHCPIIFSPEFLTEAKAWENTINPDRQIVAPTAKAKTVASRVLHLLPLAPFTAPRHKKALKWSAMNPTEAEIGKYAANTFGALKVSFANFIYDLAKMSEASLNKKGIRTRVNYDNVRRVLANDPRIGDSWLNVEYQGYRGYGGYCFPKDTEALIAFSRTLIKKMPAGSARILFQKGLKLLESMRGYNSALLAWQGLTPANVSRHDEELMKIIKRLKMIKRKSK